MHEFTHIRPDVHGDTIAVALLRIRLDDMRRARRVLLHRSVRPTDCRLRLARKVAPRRSLGV
jgi:hypothetical protein